MPAAAGTPEYEKPELWLGTGNWHRGFCHAPPRPPAGDKPPRYISPSPPMDLLSLYWGTGRASAGMSRLKPGRPAGLPFAAATQGDS